MDKVTMTDIANKLNYSKTTISKALNNCPGIHPSTKNKIISAANDCGYIHKKSTAKIAVILPAVPDYFWGNMRKKIHSLSKMMHMDCSFFVYTNLLNADDAIRCIDNVTATGARVIIAAVPDNASIKQRLEDISTDVLVILAEEFLRVKNAFFVGEDSFKEGYTLGKSYIRQYPDSALFTILYSELFSTIQQRTDGFMTALAEHNKSTTPDMACNISTHALGAYIARNLSELETLPDCIFCPSGTVSDTCLAIQKLKKDIHCIGFDMKPGQERHNALKLCELQDTDRQIEKMLEYAAQFIDNRTFPPTKNTYIDDVYYSENLF